MRCRFPRCSRDRFHRGVCQRHWIEYLRATRNDWPTNVAPYLLPSYASQPDWLLCTCLTPEPVYLPAFDDPARYPGHRGHYCARCNRPPLEGLHPAVQTKLRNLLHITTPYTEENPACNTNQSPPNPASTHPPATRNPTRTPPTRQKRADRTPIPVT